MADLGHYRAPGQTRQGLYVCSPSGKFLASINSRDPAAIIKTLDEGLKAWNALSSEERRLPDSFPHENVPRWEDSYPEGGLVLATFCRDLADDPLPVPSHRSEQWNHDHAWFSRDEARHWLPAEPAIGQEYDIPREFVERLAQFHLVDNVKGQTVPFTRQDVAGSQARIKITAREGSTVDMTISGTTQAVSGSKWDMRNEVWKPEHDHPRGVVTRMYGSAAFDLESGTFTRFDLVALGRRHGFSENNGRKCQIEPSSIGFSLSLAPIGVAKRVPPTFIDVYDGKWLVRPRPVAAIAEK